MQIQIYITFSGDNETKMKIVHKHYNTIHQDQKFKMFVRKIEQSKPAVMMNWHVSCFRILKKIR